jgi:hypothetical protein
VRPGARPAPRHATGADGAARRPAEQCLTEAAALRRLAGAAEGGGRAPRTLLLVAHPDDETIGAGALIAHLGPAVTAAGARKAAMYACHASQAGVLAGLPVAAEERFRPAPRYDFTRPPPGGPAWYERYGWGVDAATLPGAARAALEALGLASRLRDGPTDAPTAGARAPGA